MTARPSEWKRLPFGEMMPIPYRAVFDRDQYAKISEGLVPKAMEDKWFVYLENNILCFQRSWIGEGVYQVTIDRDGELYSVASALCLIKMLEVADRLYQSELLDFLIRNLLLGKLKPFPRPAGVAEQLQGIYQHAISGTDYPEKVVAKVPWWRRWR